VQLTKSTLFKAISIALVITTINQQILLAGDLIDYALEKQYVEQSQTFGPQYLKGRQDANQFIIDNKQTVEDFIRTQNSRSSSQSSSEPTKDDSLRIIGPKLSYGVARDGAVTLLDSSNIEEGGGIVSITTEQGDTIHYIERPDGTVIQNIVLGENNELLDADIIYPDGVMLFVRGGKISGAIDATGAMITYDDRERVSQAAYTDGRVVIYTYIEDGAGNTIETIVTDGNATAHYNLSTLHTNDSVGAVSRLVDLGIEPFLVSSTVIMVIAQRLVRKLCPDCKEPAKIEPKTLEKYGLGGAKVFAPIGCQKCRNRGYTGRIALFEVMCVDDEVASMIEKREEIGSIKKALIKNGMTTLRMDGLEKVRAGLTSLNEIIATTQEA